MYIPCKRKDRYLSSAQRHVKVTNLLTKVILKFKCMCNIVLNPLLRFGEFYYCLELFGADSPNSLHL